MIIFANSFLFNMIKKLNFNTVFNSFNQFNILIIGDVMIDSYMWGKVNRISPEAPVPIIMSTKQENRLGGAANVALNVQALGANPILCAVIGNDSKAKIFYNLLKDQKLSSKLANNGYNKATKYSTEKYAIEIKKIINKLTL